jgi:hypothetical protein
VVAVAEITGEPRRMRDDSPSRSLWVGGDPHTIELRAPLRITKRSLGKKEIIRREWIEHDPELKGLRILRMRSETNYAITPAEARRLAMLCRTVGKAWNRNEDIAALWAFKEVRKGPVSKRAGSPVARVAALIGRPIEGVYNKLMNFRSIDPTDEREGLANVTQVDRDAWAEFYDAASRELNAEALDREFDRLQGASRPVTAAPKPVYEGFGEAPDDDPSELAMFAAKVRKGQPKFRARLMRLYGGKCAVSGWGPPDVLEAAHIYAHAASGVNHSSNGILVRSDLHSLMDAGLLTIDPKTLRVTIADQLRTTPYWDLNGCALRRRTDGSRPSKKYLRLRFGEHDDT